MTDLAVYEEATGACAVCGEKDYTYWNTERMETVDGSLYWTPLPDNVWVVIRPHVAAFFKKDMIQNVLFVPPHSKPFCGAICATKYKETDDGDDV